MKITIDRLNDAYHMEARNEDNNTIHLDGSPEIGGENKGVRPMQLLLMSVGSCSAIDIIGILKKQKQPLEDIKIEVEGDREKMGTYSLFRDIRIHYHFEGNLDDSKVKKAIELSLDKYCSVAKTLEKTAKISYNFTIHNS